MIADDGRARKMIAAASWLVEQGFCSVGWAPVSDGKGPVRHWKADATGDPALVPGLLHGARNALVIPKDRGTVIDIDKPDTWQELADAGLPPTLTVDSPTPGHGHVYAWAPDGVTLPGTFAGGEIRRFDPKTGTTSMVLGPWSLRSDGVYAVRDGVREIATLPQSVVDYLVASARRQSAEWSAARGPDDPGWKIATGRHPYLVKMAREMRGHGLTGERLLEELVRLDGERCDPPIASLPAPRGMKELEEIADWTAAHIEDDGPDMIRDSTSATGLRFYSPLELAALTAPATTWIVRPGLLALGAITEVDGKIKAAGKTTFSLHMVRAALDGADFLGYPTRKSRVLYVTEQSRHTFVDTLRLCGLDKRGDELRILFREDLNGTSWKDVVQACRQDGYDVAVFDTIGKLAGIKEENAAGEWAVAMSPLQDLAASGRAVLIDRHDRKGGGDVGDSGRGSSQASGDVDIILALRRPEGNQASSRRVIESLSRYRETPEKIVVELTPDGYVLLGTDEAVATADAETFVSCGLEAEYQTNGIGLTRAVLEERGKERNPKIADWAIRAALTSLEAAGRVARAGRGVKGDPYIYSLVARSAVSGETQTFTHETNSDPDYLAIARSVWGDEISLPESGQPTTIVHPTCPTCGQALVEAPGGRYVCTNAPGHPMAIA